MEKTLDLMSPLILDLSFSSQRWEVILPSMCPKTLTSPAEISPLTWAFSPMVILPLSEVISPSIFQSIIMSLEKRIEPMISIPVERTLVAFAIAQLRKQNYGWVATGKKF